MSNFQGSLLLLACLVSGCTVGMLFNLSRLCLELTRLAAKVRERLEGPAARRD